MSDSNLYRQHLERLDVWLADSLERAAAASGVRAVGALFHAGSEVCYHADDEAIPFRATPHLLRWVPLDGPDHCVLARPGSKPRVFRVAPRDYWHEVLPLESSYWQEAVDLVEVESFESVCDEVSRLRGIAYVGGDPAAAARLGVEPGLVEPEALMAPLDWYRAYKTPHELALIEVACARAANGHERARAAFENGASELELFREYLAGSEQLQLETPFGCITALDDKAAVLHYQNKRCGPASPGNVFLLDAGARHDGYASDITRTWAKEDAPREFRELLACVDELQRELVGMVRPGSSFVDLHRRAHELTAAALARVGLVSDASRCLADGVTRTFLPHGLGHHLGIQVHDIGGRQSGPGGGTLPPPVEYPLLRNTRSLEPGHLVTIEPGVYFIPMLLDELRASGRGGSVNWELVERLLPCGGIRIEDDVLCTEGEPRDLTRSLVPGPRGV
jgi:Xaa-Pro dipeptidase